LQPKPGAPIVFGKYLLIERIAAGGMAEVFRAVMRGAAGFEKVVAVKRILPLFGEEPEFVALFQDEARIVSTLTHVNIVQVFDFGEVDGAFYLTLELVDGLDLAKLSAKLKAAQQPMPMATAAFVVAEAARGLAYAHEKRGPDGRLYGIVHRDVSPPNILLSFAGEVKVADFGIAKAAGKSHKTATGVVMGKLRYMSPEQVAAEELDPRSDIFSLGVILYELLVNGPIFQGDQSIRLAELIHTATIPPPSTRNPDVPTELDQIVMRALHKDRDRRYHRAADMSRDLAKYVSSKAPDFTRDDLAALLAQFLPPSRDAEGRPSSSLEIVPAGGPVAAGAVIEPAGEPAGQPAGESAGRPLVEPVIEPDPGEEPLLLEKRRASSATTVPVLIAGSMRPSIPAHPVPGDPAFVSGISDGHDEPPVEALSASPGADVAANDMGPEAEPELGPGPGPARRGPHHGAGTLDEAPAAPRGRRRLSTEAWVGLALGAVILGSGALVLVRFALPGRDAVAVRVDGGSRAHAGADAGSGKHEVPEAPFTLLPDVTPERKRELAARADGNDLTRRGLPSPEYDEFLTALDGRVAQLALDEQGRALPPDPGEDAAEPTAAVMAYIRATGELPPMVKTALRQFLRDRPSVAVEDAWIGNAHVTPYSAAALAVWLDPKNRRRLQELALANDVLGRWCASPPSPARHFAAVLCERDALIAALRSLDPGDPVARALERQARSTSEIVLGSAGKVAVADTSYAIASASEYRLVVKLHMSGVEPLPADAFKLAAAGLPAATLQPEPAPQPQADDTGAANLDLAFRVPRRIVAPVLLVAGSEGNAYLAVSPPPWGGLR
jgi:serine/threonine protein kinase